MKRHGLALAPLAVLCAVGSMVGGHRAVPDAAGAPPEETPLRAASQVVVRGKKTLELAIRAAMPTAVAGAPPPVVAFVVDVTPNVVKRGEVLRSTLARLREDAGFAREIRVTSIGKSLGAAPKTPEDLQKSVATVLKKETPVVNTMLELRKSLAALREPAVAVYLCDWRFEDDFQVDALAQDLLDRQVVLSVVGTEAAFGRAWTDGTVGVGDRMSGRTPITGEYFPGIGRSPFGRPAADAPWHGGDSAYPALPYRYNEFLWTTEFQKPSKPITLNPPPKDAPGGMDGPTPDEAEEPEDLGARLGFPSVAEMADASRTYPIPSGFGPYGLMRLCAVTGGRYVLWSWNPGGRARVTYDYGRCDLFGADLRSRERILSEVTTDPIAAATLAAWHALLAADGVVDQTPPLDKDGKTARAIDDTPGSADFRWTWGSPVGSGERFARPSPGRSRQWPRPGSSLETALGHGEGGRERRGPKATGGRATPPLHRPGARVRASRARSRDSRREARSLAHDAEGRDPRRGRARVHPGQGERPQRARLRRHLRQWVPGARSRRRRADHEGAQGAHRALQGDAVRGSGRARGHQHLPHRRVRGGQAAVPRRT